MSKRAGGVYIAIGGELCLYLSLNLSAMLKLLELAKTRGGRSRGKSRFCFVALLLSHPFDCPAPQHHTGLVQSTGTQHWYTALVNPPILPALSRSRDEG